MLSARTARTERDYPLSADLLFVRMTGCSRPIQKDREDQGREQAGNRGRTGHDRDLVRALHDLTDAAALLGVGHVAARERLVRRDARAVRTGDRAGAHQPTAAARRLHIHQRPLAGSGGRTAAAPNLPPDPQPDDAARPGHHRSARSRDPADLTAWQDTWGARRSDGEPGRDQARRPHDREGRRCHHLHDHRAQHRPGRRAERDARRRTGRPTPAVLGTPGSGKLPRSAAASSVNSARSPPGTARPCSCVSRSPTSERCLPSWANRGSDRRRVRTSRTPGVPTNMQPAEIASLATDDRRAAKQPPPSALLPRRLRKARDGRRCRAATPVHAARAVERKRSALHCIQTPRYPPGKRRGDSLTRW
jgi:hypothetical protein